MLEKVKNREKAEKDRKGGFDLELYLWQRNTLLLEVLITFERKVPKRSDASQNDHKSKGYPSKTSTAAFTMQKSDRGAYRRLGHQTFY